MPFILKLIEILPDDEIKKIREQEQEDKMYDEGGIFSLSLTDKVSSKVKKISNRVERIFRESAPVLGSYPVHRISETESKSYHFPIGHPKVKMLYVSNPTDPTVFYTLASYHKKVFEHKVSEAIRLLVALGAKEIEISHVKGWSNSKQVSVFEKRMKEDEDRKIINEDIGLDSKSSQKRNSKIMFSASYSSPKAPRLPEGLTWYKDSPQWQTVVDGRLYQGMEKFSFSIEYDDDLSINSKFNKMAEKQGYDIGGDFEEHVSTTWEVSGVFHKI